MDMTQPRRFGRPELPALLMGSVMCAILLGAEIALRLNEGASEIRRTATEGHHDLSRHNIMQARPGKHRVTTTDGKTGQLIVEAEYSIDAFGRRITPRRVEIGAKFRLFFGDSFTYGEGVKGDETLPSHVASLAPEYVPYNYGFSGMGPFDVLARLETVDFSQEVPQTRGIVLYTFLDLHIQRTSGGMSISPWHKERAYYDVTEDGHFTRNGTFQSGDAS
jgi:hypothetical protein